MEPTETLGEALGLPSLLPLLFTIFILLGTLLWFAHRSNSSEDEDEGESKTKDEEEPKMEVEEEEGKKSFFGE